MTVRAARVYDDFIEAEIREYRRRENELRQQTQGARTSTPAADAEPTPKYPDPDVPSKNAAASTASSRPVVRQSRSMEGRRRPAAQSEVTTTMLRRWASLRLHRELLHERQRELELVQQGRIDTTSEQRRVTLT